MSKKSDCPALWRETDIQTDKLQRMVKKFRKKFPLAEAYAVLGGKEARKQIGPEMHRLEQQSKKISELLGRVMEEHYMVHPVGRTVKRRTYRKVMPILIQHFEKKVYLAANELKADMLAAMPDRKKISS